MSKRTISFTIPGKPQPQLRPRFTGRGGYVRTYDPAKCKAAKKIISDVATMTAFDCGLAQPLTGAISVEVIFSMPIPKSVRADTGDPHVKKPDLDNLLKLVLDAITDSGAIWADDSQVVAVSAHKMYSTKPQTYIYVRED